MDTEALDPQTLHSAPPLMPWQRFAEWIGMGDEPIVVRTWIDGGYLPTEKVGKSASWSMSLCSLGLFLNGNGLYERPKLRRRSV